MPAFTPPPLDSIESPKFTPPPLDSIEKPFTPPPLESEEKQGGRMWEDIKRTWQATAGTLIAALQRPADTVYDDENGNQIRVPYEQHQEMFGGDATKRPTRTATEARAILKGDVPLTSRNTDPVYEAAVATTHNAIADHPLDPDYEKSLTHTITSGVTMSAPILASAALNPVLGAEAAMLLFGQQMRQQAVDSGHPDQADNMELAGTALGAVAALPFGKVITGLRIGNPVVQNAVRTLAAGATEEALQPIVANTLTKAIVTGAIEGAASGAGGMAVATVGSNVAARGLGVDEERSPFAGLGDAMAGGGILGLVFGATAARKGFKNEQKAWETLTSAYAAEVPNDAVLSAVAAYGKARTPENLSKIILEANRTFSGLTPSQQADVLAGLSTRLGIDPDAVPMKNVTPTAARPPAPAPRPSATPEPSVPAEPVSPAQTEFESQLGTQSAVVRGNTTTVLGANGTEYPATYAWAPTGLIQPSHSGESLAPNPAYPLTNTRDYSDQAEKDKALDTRNRWDPRRAITDSPDAAVGPPMVARVIAEDGTATLAVLGGNNRQWAIQNLPPEKTQSTLELSNAKASQFGLAPAPDPAHQLIRFLGTVDTRKSGERERMQAMVDALNPSPGMVQSSAKRAEIDAAALPLEKLAGATMEIAPNEAQTFVRSLIEAGHADRNRTAAIASSGAQSQDYVQRLLVNAAFRTPALAEARNDARAGNATFRGLIDAATPSLIALRERGANDVADAISRSFATTLDYTGKKGAETLPQALDAVAAQDELDPVHAPAQAIAKALRERLVVDKAGRVQTEPTIAAARELFAGIHSAVQHHVEGGDMFGPGRTLPETVMAGVQGRVMDDPTPYLDANNVTDPARRADFIAEKRKLDKFIDDGQLDLFRYPSGHSLPAPGGGSADARGSDGRAAAHLRAQLLARLGRGEAVSAAELSAAFVQGRTISSILPDLVEHQLGFDVRGSLVETAADWARLNTTLRTPYFESVRVAVLDANGRIEASGIVHVGSINESVCSPITITSWVQRHSRGGKRVLIAHNHPSGDPTPSRADHEITPKVRMGLKMAGYKLEDHVITDGHQYYSFEGESVREFEQPVMAAWELVARNQLPNVSSSASLVAITSTLRTGDPDAVHVIYLTTRFAVTAIERLPVGEDLANAIMSSVARHGAFGVAISWPGSATPMQEHSAFGIKLSMATVRLIDMGTPQIPSFKAAGLMEKGMIKVLDAENTRQQLREEPEEYSPVQFSDKGNPYNVNVRLAGLPGIKIIQMPELIQLARELMGEVPAIGKMKKARGQFVGIGNGAIKLDRRIFADPISAAKTLAHEIGHLADYLPQQTMKRGNLWGRLQSLSKYMKERFGTTISTTTNAQLRAELIALSDHWKPIDRLSGSKSYVAYRESAVELYADFVSVLFNSPELAKQLAPKFFAEFFKGLDTKPEVKKAFFDLQAWLNRPAMEVLKDRSIKAQEMFAKGEAIFEAKHQERLARHVGFKGWLSRFKQEYHDNFAPLIDREKARGGAGAHTAAWLFEESPFVDNRVYRWLERMQRTVIAPIEAAGFSQSDLGELLFFHRIANERYAVTGRIAAELGINTGGRSVIANPQGHTPQTARLQLLRMRLENGIKSQTLLEAAKQKFHDEVFQVMQEAHKVGLLSDQQMATISGNRDNYATFTPLEYVDLWVPAAIRAQAGTFKDAANPFFQTTLKMITMHRAIEFQKLKVQAVNTLTQYFPAEIERATTRRDAAGNEKPVPPKGEGIKQIELREKGKAVWYNVPSEIAVMFEKLTPGHLGSVLEVVDSVFRGFFYKAFITFNPLFQLLRNPIRDFRRTYTNAAEGVGFWDIARQLPLAKHIGHNPAFDGVKQFIKTGQQTPLIAEAMENLAITPGDAAFASTAGRTPSTFDRMLQGFGVLPADEQAHKWAQWPVIKQIVSIGEAIETVGKMNELLPKVSGYHVLTNKLGWTPREAAHYIRTYAGTPNWTRKGNKIKVPAVVFPFINIWMKGWHADASLALGGYQRKARPGPGKSAASWWFRWAATSGIWTVLKVAASIGLLGVGIKKLMDGVSSHYKVNYDVLPIGHTGQSDYDPEGKVAFIPIPKDPADRILSGLLYNMLHAGGLKLAQAGLFGDELKQANAAEASTATLGDAITASLSVGASDVPGLNPLFRIASGWKDYAAGQNPIDGSRGSFVLSDKEYLAGGSKSVGPMLAWTYNQTGLGSFISYDPKASTTTEQILSSVPMLKGTLKITDYGHAEVQQAGERMEKTAAARIALGMPANAQRLAAEIGMLRGLGKADRTPAQEERFRTLSAWHSRIYKRAEETLANAKDNEISASEMKQIRANLENDTRQFER